MFGVTIMASKRTSNNEIYKVLLEHGDRLGRIEGQLSKIDELKETIERNFEVLRHDLEALDARINANENEILKMKQTAKTVGKVGAVGGAFLSALYLILELFGRFFH